MFSEKDASKKGQRGVPVFYLKLDILRFLI